jgi:hypothetical protein
VAKENEACAKLGIIGMKLDLDATDCHHGGGQIMVHNSGSIGMTSVALTIAVVRIMVFLFIDIVGARVVGTRSRRSVAVQVPSIAVGPRV